MRAGGHCAFVDNDATRHTVSIVQGVSGNWCKGQLLSVAPGVKMAGESRETILMIVTVREARAQLSRLLREAENGEVVTITRRGEPIALLVPEVSRTIAAIKEFRKGNRLDGLRIKDLSRKGAVNVRP